MRQVPRYLLIGDGRTAKHFRQYFSLLRLSVDTWHRKEPEEELKSKLQHASHVILCISDAAIEEFIIQKNIQTICIHISGSVVTEHAYGAHPLMTFNSGSYCLEQYQSIPFILDHSAPKFEELLPGLPNPHVRLHTSLKAKYHALCVLSGNFSCMLWQKFFETLEEEFNFPASIGHPYLMQQMQNLMSDPKNALTGPLVRNDQVTIEKNLVALESESVQKLYQSFVHYYQEKQK